MIDQIVKSMGSTQPYSTRKKEVKIRKKNHVLHNDGKFVQFTAFGKSHCQKGDAYNSLSG